jgi:PAS domain-containing protein
LAGLPTMVLEKIQNRTYLLNARNKYSDLFNNAPVGYLILDRSGMIREVNRTFALQVEVDLDHLLGKPFADYLTRTSKHSFHSQFKSFFNRPENKILLGWALGGKFDR